MSLSVCALLACGSNEHEDPARQRLRTEVLTMHDALRAEPDSATAAYNLGVVLEDLGKPEEATEVYRRAIECDRLLADAYYNLSRLYERAGDRAAALRHLRSYSELVKIN